MITRQTDSRAKDDGPDLSDQMYCEHGRTRGHCEDCRAGGYAPRSLAPDDIPPVVSSAGAGPVFPCAGPHPRHLSASTVRLLSDRSVRYSWLRSRNTCSRIWSSAIPAPMAQASSSQLSTRLVRSQSM
jgi:hypothetical protein